MRSRIRVFAALMCSAALLVSANPAEALETVIDWNEVGAVTGSVGLSLLYTPLKLVYSTLGVVIGGFAYGLSAGDPEVAKAVITPAVRGDYVVMPDHLRGERPLEMIGRDPSYVAEVDTEVDVQSGAWSDPTGEVEVEQSVVYEETY